MNESTLRTIRFVAICLGMTLLALAYTLVVYAKLPDTIPTHWGIDGKPDAWGPKESSSFLCIYLMLGLTAMFAVLPALSPKTKPIHNFRDTYDLIGYIIIALTGYIQVIVLLGAQGSINVGFAIILGMLIMFGLMGNNLGKIKPNYYMGIRTPWTLESDLVWEKTHRLAGRLLVGTSVLAIILVFAGLEPFYAIFLCVGALIGPAFYSYFLYKQETSSDS